MNFTVEEEGFGLSKKYVLFLENNELVRLLPDTFTRQLLYECDKSNSIADKLLALEHIVRKIENDQELKKSTQVPPQDL